MDWLCGWFVVLIVWGYGFCGCRFDGDGGLVYYDWVIIVVVMVGGG